MIYKQIREYMIYKTNLNNLRQHIFCDYFTKIIFKIINTLKHTNFIYLCTYTSCCHQIS